MEVLTKLIAAGFVTTCVCALIGMFINTVFYFVGLVIVAFILIVCLFWLGG